MLEIFGEVAQNSISTEKDLVLFKFLRYILLFISSHVYEFNSDLPMWNNHNNELYQLICYNYARNMIFDTWCWYTKLYTLHNNVKKNTNYPVSNKVTKTVKSLTMYNIKLRFLSVSQIQDKSQERIWRKVKLTGNAHVSKR